MGWARPSQRGSVSAASWGASRVREAQADVGGKGVERAMGIEPTLSAWEAEVLPLNYARARPSIIGISLQNSGGNWG